ncbi:E2 domain-containing protein [Ciceribacter lividus]|uniref:E2 domain-containing protein n=1 Tax=Ciceribacter lividus TaxID=1197950 RepID=UPI0011C045EC|nr:E2 domain-containing protein [Ciceribacter lividus]
MDHILQAAPVWFRVASHTESEVLGSAHILLDNAVCSIEVDLRVHDQGGEIAVQELVPGTSYPKTCHERHLQSDEHFCIGFNAGKGIVSKDHAVVWWGLLRHFLKLQRVAERTGRWPPQQELAHGSAGAHQLAAIAAAKDLGIEDEYMDMLAGQSAWFADSGLQLNARNRLKNSWLPCPVGCRKNGKPISRAVCCRPAAVAALITQERLRRKKTADFHWLARASGEQCCGTMLKCGLRDTPLDGVVSSDNSGDESQGSIRTAKSGEA